MYICSDLGYEVMPSQRMSKYTRFIASLAGMELVSKRMRVRDDKWKWGDGLDWNLNPSALNPAIQSTSTTRKMVVETAP